MDPLAAKYPHNSPYAFSENKVIDHIELEGLEGYAAGKVKQIWQSWWDNEALPALKNADEQGVVGYLQLGLDIVGFVPVVGDVADLANGIIYTARGDYANAAISYIAIVPYVGDAAKVGRFGTKAQKLTIRVGNNIDELVDIGRQFVKASQAVKFTRLVTKYSDELGIKGAEKVANAIWDKSKLRKVLRVGRDEWDYVSKQAHHIIPVELIERNPFVREAINDGYKFNSETNGIFLERSRHFGSHPDYTNALDDRINAVFMNPDFSHLSSKEKLEFVTNNTRNDILNSDKKVNELYNE